MPIADGKARPATTAYDKAVQTFRQKLSKEEADSICNSRCDINDVLDAAQAAQQSCAHTGMMTGFINVANNYKDVMDVICQFHPECLALLWASMKFLLKVRLFFYYYLGLN